MLRPVQCEIPNQFKLDGFEWVLGRRFLRTRGYENYLHCTPTVAEETSIWSCDVQGEVTFCRDGQEDQTEFWMYHLDFINKSGRLYCFTADRTIVTLTVVKQTLVNLSNPRNEMIKSTYDAAQVVVEGKTLWLSKSILSNLSHFFNAFFNSDFKEKRTGRYELHAINLSEFLHFVALLYGVHVDIDHRSVEYLLNMADMYQCDLVTSRCRSYLARNDKDAFLPPMTKLALADRFGFVDVLNIAIQSMDEPTLRTSAENSEALQLNHFTNKLLARRLEDFYYEY